MNGLESTNMPLQIRELRVSNCASFSLSLHLTMGTREATQGGREVSETLSYGEGRREGRLAVKE